jgi:hypothetical protein
MEPKQRDHQVLYGMTSTQGVPASTFPSSVQFRISCHAKQRPSHKPWRSTVSKTYSAFTLLPGWLKMWDSWHRTITLSPDCPQSVSADSRLQDWICPMR